MFNQIFAGGRVFLDAACRRNMIGRHTVPEDAQCARPGNIGEWVGGQDKIREEGRFLDVGAVGVPGINISRR